MASMQNITAMWLIGDRLFALHTLQVLALRWRFPPKFALFMLAIVWLIILVLLAVHNVVQGKYMVPYSIVSRHGPGSA